MFQRKSPAEKLFGAAPQGRMHELSHWNRWEPLLLFLLARPLVEAPSASSDPWRRQRCLQWNQWRLCSPARSHWLSRQFSHALITLDLQQGSPLSDSMTLRCSWHRGNMELSLHGFQTD